jgi:predicted MFS family arabinose efflux permease
MSIVTQEPLCEPEQATSDDHGDVYTVFTARQQWMIIIILNFAMLTSPLTGSIYLPLLPMLSESCSTSVQAINLTITLYIVFQALSPLLLSSTSDHFGRRPIFSSLSFSTLVRVLVYLSTSGAVQRS